MRYLPLLLLLLLLCDCRFLDKKIIQDSLVPPGVTVATQPIEKQSLAQPKSSPPLHQFVYKLSWAYPEFPDAIDHYEVQGSTNLLNWQTMRFVNNQSNSCTVTSLWSSAFSRLYVVSSTNSL